MTDTPDLTDPSDRPVDDLEEEQSAPPAADEIEADVADVLENSREVGGDDEDYPRSARPTRLA